MGDSTNNGFESESGERQKHEMFISDLSNMQAAQPRSLEARLDKADMSYQIAYNAGIIEGAFEYPSVRRTRLQREAVAEARPRSLAIYSVRQGDIRAEYDYKSYEELKDFQTAHRLYKELGFSGPAAILEIVNDNDYFNGSTSAEWLACDSVKQAEEYVQRVGIEESIPGPGEDDGIYTSRTIFLNPNYSAPEKS